MFQTIQILKGLNNKQIKIFVNQLFDDEINMSKEFIKLLKSLSDEDLHGLYNKIDNAGFVKWFNSEIKKSATATDEEILLIDAKLAEIAATIPQKRAEMEANTIQAKALVLEYRKIMKAGFEEIGKSLTDQNEGIEIPPVQKPVADNAEVVNLPEVDRTVLQEVDVFNCLNNRKSRRGYKDESISLAELSFLLWATQGVQGKFYNDTMTRRTVPSGGARNPFETYLAINNVAGLKPGIYRYQPLQHQLVYLFEVEDQKAKVAKASLDQGFVGNCAVTFIWSTIPYRCEWRYTVESKKIILQDSGHLCQNLYIACEAIGCGTCAIGAYSQKLFDELLQLDGVDEFTVYVAPVGKVAKSKPAIKLTTDRLEKLCGWYHCDSESISRKIYLKEGSLYYWRDEESEDRLIPVAENELKMDTSDTYLTFEQIDGKQHLHFKSEGDKELEFISFVPKTLP